MVIHSFLLVGQSNMAGRGFKTEVEPIPNDNIFVLRNGRWWPMYVPVNPDRANAGISLAESFAYQYALEHPGVQVGLIPCADGGTSLEQWAEGDVLFDHAVMMAKLAQRNSCIKGILWHQGEAECWDEAYPHYEEKCVPILQAMRKVLGLEDVPLLLGALGDYLQENEYEHFKNYVHINASLEQMAQKLPNAGFVSAKGLDSNADKLHFNARSLREFGLRYYEAYKKLAKAETGAMEAPSVQLHITEMEKL